MFPMLMPPLTVDSYPKDMHNVSQFWSSDGGVFATVTDPKKSLDSALAAAFDNILAITNGAAARALSTIITMLYSMGHYNDLQFFKEKADDVVVAFFQTTAFPHSFRGFAAVLVVLLVHCSLVLLITTVFIRSTHLTTLGDHWKAVAQVISLATVGFLAESSDATDRDVNARIKAEGREGEVVNIRRLHDEGGNIGLVARRAY
jgi:hypothetical protein